MDKEKEENLTSPYERNLMEDRKEKYASLATHSKEINYEFIMNPERPQRVGLDYIDAGIIAHIWGWQKVEKDCLESNDELAEIFGVTRETIRKKLNNLEEQRYIRRYTYSSNGNVKNRKLYIDLKGWFALKWLTENPGSKEPAVSFDDYYQKILDSSGLSEAENLPRGSKNEAKTEVSEARNLPREARNLPRSEAENLPLLYPILYHILDQYNRKESDSMPAALERESGGTETPNPDTLTIKQFIELDDEAKNDFLNNIRDDCFGYDKRFATSDDIFTSRENKRFAAEIQEDCLRTIGSSEEIFTRERKDALFDDIVERILNKI